MSRLATTTPLQSSSHLTTEEQSTMLDILNTKSWDTKPVQISSDRKDDDEQVAKINAVFAYMTRQVTILRKAAPAAAQAAVSAIAGEVASRPDVDNL